MNPTKKYARFAGLLYLLMGLFCAFGLLYVPSKIVVVGNAVLTAKNMIASEPLFRAGICSSLIGQIIFIFLAVALYRLFKDVDTTQARLMLVLVVAAVPIMFINNLIQTGALIIAHGADNLKVFEPDKLNALMMLFLNLYNYGIYVVGIFWGLWLYPFGYLVYKSGFIPKILGILLIINCFGYLIDSFSFLLIPGYYHFISKFTMVMMSAGEFPMIFWLVIMGIKERKPNLAG